MGRFRNLASRSFESNKIPRNLVGTVADSVACAKKVFEYAENDISIPNPRFSLGDITAWTSCMAFCTVTDVFFPKTIIEKECYEQCSEVTQKVDGMCDGNVYCDSMCNLPSKKSMWTS